MGTVGRPKRAHAAGLGLWRISQRSQCLGISSKYHTGRCGANYFLLYGLLSDASTARCLKQDSPPTSDRFTVRRGRKWLKPVSESESMRLHFGGWRTV